MRKSGKAWQGGRCISLSSSCMRVTIIIISFALTFFVSLFVVVKEKMHFLSYFQPLKPGFQLTLVKRYAACFTKGLKRSTLHLKLTKPPFWRCGVRATRWCTASPLPPPSDMATSPPQTQVSREDKRKRSMRSFNIPQTSGWPACCMGSLLGPWWASWSPSWSTWSPPWSPSPPSP